MWSNKPPSGCSASDSTPQSHSPKRSPCPQAGTQADPIHPGQRSTGKPAPQLTVCLGWNAPSRARAGLSCPTAPLGLEKQLHVTCLDATAKHLVAELASAWAAVRLINFNYSVYTNKQAEALDTAGASDGLALGEEKGAKATAHKSFASGQVPLPFGIKIIHGASLSWQGDSL